MLNIKGINYKLLITTRTSTVDAIDSFSATPIGNVSKLRETGYKSLQHVVYGKVLLIKSNTSLRYNFMGGCCNLKSNMTYVMIEGDVT